MSTSKLYKPRKWTFFSQGNSYDFDPKKNANYNGALTTQLEMHWREVVIRNKPHTFILDDTGQLYEGP